VTGAGGGWGGMEEDAFLGGGSRTTHRGVCRCPTANVGPKAGSLLGTSVYFSLKIVKVGGGLCQHLSSSL